MATTRQSLEDFLQPLNIELSTIHSLARGLCDTFKRLAAESPNQFLPTPISDSILRESRDEKGRYLAIDIGGTNLRVAFVELLGDGVTSFDDQIHAKHNDVNSLANDKSRVHRLLEKSWFIQEQLKNNNAEDLFAWIGKCVAEVVQDGCQTWENELPEEIPMGVTFSFPMMLVYNTLLMSLTNHDLQQSQNTLSDATLMPMGKGFAISSNLNLGNELLNGYKNARSQDLPQIKIAAITNDAVSTLVSFVYQHGSNPRRKAAMGLIVGTGCNATIPLDICKLHASKRPKQVNILDGGGSVRDLKIIVNTEWTINGAAVPLHDLNLVTHWDRILDSEGEAPGFQPFEYMTAGRYLGELGRIVITDYFTNQLGIPKSAMPPNLRRRYGLTTTFLGNLGPHLGLIEPSIVKQLEAELPPDSSGEAWNWTSEIADVVFRIAKAIQVRAAGMTAAAIIGLLACSDEIKLSPLTNLPNLDIPLTAMRKMLVDELTVGYTGGCIVHFQDYLEDCQTFLDKIMLLEFGESPVPRIVLQPCHDGGIIGAGILAGTVHRVVP